MKKKKRGPMKVSNSARRIGRNFFDKRKLMGIKLTHDST